MTDASGSNVRHVPELKKKIIALGYLERQGYGFSSQPASGVLKITKGSLVAQKGTRMSNNLYRMVGAVVTRKPEVLCCTTEIIKLPDRTRIGVITTKRRRNKIMKI